MHCGGPPANDSAEVTAIISGNLPGDAQPKEVEAGSGNRVTPDAAEVTAIFTNGPQAGTPGDTQPKGVDATASSTEVTVIVAGTMPDDVQPSSSGVLAASSTEVTAIVAGAMPDDVQPSSSGVLACRT